MTSRERIATILRRVNWPEVEANYRRWRAEGQFIAFSALPGYEATWRRSGPENTFMAMASDGEWIREMCDADAEQTVAVAKEGGGYIYHSGHLVPHTVSLEQYRTVLGIVRKYAWY